MFYKAAIFDMDGTILNTSPDLTSAINYAMKTHGHRHDFEIADGCLFFGSGAHTAIQRALALEAGMDREEILQIGSARNGEVPGIDESEVLKILAVYSPYYKAHNAIDTRPYDGISDLLKDLRKAHLRLRNWQLRQTHWAPSQTLVLLYLVKTLHLNPHCPLPKKPHRPWRSKALRSLPC